MMKRPLLVSLVALAASLSSSSHGVFAQAAPARPGATPAAPATPTIPGAPPGTMSLNDVAQHPELTKPPTGLVDFTIEDGDLAELITTISTITGKRFIYGGKVRNIKVNIYAPKQQKITVAEAYQTFLSVLETNGLTVIPHGRFLKIVESAGIAAQATPLYNTGQPVPPDDRYVTRLYRLGHISADEVAAILGKFKSKDADITVYAPGNLLILTDTASNIRRMLELIEEVDVGGAGDQVWVEPIHYMTASEVAQRINEIFDVKAAAAPAAPGKPNSSLSDTRISKIIPEDRGNSLIIVATERAYLRVLELIRRLDVPNTGEGEVHVLPLQHAMAEELATTLNAILTGAAAAARPAPAGGAAPGGGGGIFEGAIKVTADKATNSLVITSSLRDYGAMRAVIDRLDMPRRQVFIEAVIMDLSVAHSTKVGLKYHGADPVNILSDQSSVLYGGLNPIASLGGPAADAANLQGLAIGVQGPNISSNLLGTGISIPAFGVILSALATSSDVNVLATPHIIATDNVAAEINVGENIPLQTNVGGSTSGLSALAGASGSSALGALSGLGGLGGFAAPRQDVGTKIKVVPHINDSDEVRLELTEEISERGAATGQLGAVSITKRNAQTTVVVQDQQTVVVGGLMRDSVLRSENKVPVLGDIPVLGALFRSTEKTTSKTNLLLILTPYVIRNQNDLRTVFERKMQERQEFLDRYFVFSDQKNYEPPRDWSRTNGLVEEIRQAYLALGEKQRLEEETRPREVRTHEAQQSIELPVGRGALPLGAVGPTPAPSRGPTPGATAAGAVQAAPPAAGAAVAPVIVPLPVGGGAGGTAAGGAAATTGAPSAGGATPGGGAAPGAPPGAGAVPTSPGGAGATPPPGVIPPGATPPGATPPGSSPGPAPTVPPPGNTPPAGSTPPTVPQGVAPTTMAPRRPGAPPPASIVPPLGSLAMREASAALPD